MVLKSQCSTTFYPVLVTPVPWSRITTYALCPLRSPSHLQDEVLSPFLSLSVSLSISLSLSDAHARTHTGTHTHTLLRTPFQSAVLKFSKTALMLLARIYVDRGFYASVHVSIHLSDVPYCPTPAIVRYRFGGKKSKGYRIMAERIRKENHWELKRSQYVVCCYLTGKSNILVPIDLCRMILPLISLRLTPVKLGLIIQGLADGRKYPLRPICI